MSEFIVTKRTLDKLERVMKSQDRYGIKKYGKELSHADEYDWLAMLLEELADGLKYLQCEMDRKAYVIELLKSATRQDDAKTIKEYLEVALELMTVEGTGK